MQITVYSVIMTVLWSSLLIIFFSILQRNYRLLDICSVSGILLLYLFCMIRMFVPIEFFWVTIIHSDRIFNFLHTFFYSTVPLPGHDGMEVKNLLMSIWIIVSIFLLIRLIIHYLRMNRNIAKLSWIKDEELDSILMDIEKKQKQSLKVKVVRSSEIDTPLGVGIIQKWILVPDRKYSRKDLFYIIRHEYMHHKNHDLFVQMLVNILCVIYWWNPFVYLLRMDIEHSFEMRCDQTVVHGMDDGEIADYLETLLAVFQLREGDKKDEKYATGMLGRNNWDAIRRRFNTLLRESAVGYKTYGKQVAAIVMLAVLILSYSFIIQPKILPTDTDMGISSSVHKVETNTSYILHYKDGTYELITPGAEHVVLDEDMVQQMMEDGFQIIEEQGGK